MGERLTGQAVMLGLSGCETSSMVRVQGPGTGTRLVGMGDRSDTDLYLLRKPLFAAAKATATLPGVH